MAEPYERVVLVGGPCDGQEVTVPAGRLRWLAPAPLPTHDPGFWTEPSSFPTYAHYRVRLDHGYPSRDDAGRLVFEFERAEVCG